MFPVNYSVATNEDIFRFLKYDIIIEFLRKEIEHEFFEFTFLEKIDWFIYRNLQKILANILSFIPKVSHSMESLKPAFDKIKPEFDK